MNALWMIGLFIVVAIASVLALTLCRAAALADRDVDLPKSGECLRPLHMRQRDDIQETNNSPSVEQASLSPPEHPQFSIKVHNS